MTDTCGSFLTCEELQRWLKWQLEKWDLWARQREEAWLALPTGNPGFPALRHMLAHAFTPLHRYSDQVLGVDPITPPSLDACTWDELFKWSTTCLERYAHAIAATETTAPDARTSFVTRSAGIMEVRTRHALVHAATHCAWHLGGVVHLLRQAGIEPPQRSDLIFWAWSEG